ncbi:hypothetical protein [Oceanispirochaeta sp. M2]|uniref:hypothetical protein n=1 Tax=Oceanispirochaeta sp. M2 TaxID=2735869 RepID=UPI0015561AB3|nr:hypothetical protein [Oceanispirochaeta sp. M2]MBF9017748.1 hypothetical protein [Oceanispirochaeta sp. M2]
MLRKIIKSNIYLEYFIKNTIMINNVSRNNLILNISRRSELNDYIESPEIDKLRELVFELRSIGRKKNELLRLNNIDSESLLYGHIDSLINYSKCISLCKVEYPFIEHGIDFEEEEVNVINTMIFQGAYKRSKVSNIRLPFFTIGPYIHYSKNLFDTEKMNKLKKEYGKTLLYFPSHSMETFNIEYDVRENIEYITNNYSDNYDTFIVCMYWNDIANEVDKLYKKYGFKVVTAGLRSDRNFLDRLKTIILLSDTVLLNDLTTALGYSIFLKKPVVIRAHEIKKNFMRNDGDDLNPCDGQYNDTLNIALKLFNNKNKITEEQLVFVEKYWGLSNIKSEDEIKFILELNAKIIKYSLGFRFLYSAVVFIKTKFWCKGSDRMMDNKLKLLLESLNR